MTQWMRIDRSAAQRISIQQDRKNDNDDHNGDDNDHKDDDDDNDKDDDDEYDDDEDNNQANNNQFQKTISSTKIFCEVSCVKWSQVISILLSFELVQGGRVMLR